jgi:metal-sulfur cluster biosynthetic enzyme
MDDDEDRFDAVDVYCELSQIMDPERHGCTLGDLNVVAKDRIQVRYLTPKKAWVRVELLPTVPHCSFMSLIALCVRAKLVEVLPRQVNWKIDIALTPGSHLDEKDLTRRANDKERVAAALETPPLFANVEKLINPWQDSH